jgi:hypothetical protein
MGAVVRYIYDAFAIRVNAVEGLSRVGRGIKKACSGKNPQRDGMLLLDHALLLEL